MSSFTPRAWKSQPGAEAEHRPEPPVGPSQPRGVIKSHNLRIASTAFIGREHDVADVKALLNDHRLVTLVGSGGVGKTRLAMQVGSELLDRYPDGVWFVDFAPIADPELVSSVTAQALSMSPYRDTYPLTLVTSDRSKLFGSRTRQIRLDVSPPGNSRPKLPIVAPE
jgi:hypothetical protein